MAHEAFKTKYQHVNIIETPAILQDVSSDKIELAKHNIEQLFDTLPEYQKTILNQLGLTVRLGHGRNATKRERINFVQKRFSTFDSPVPISIALDVMFFSSFEYTPGVPLDDRQRNCETKLFEEAAHGVFMRYTATLLQEAAWQDLRGENSTRDWLLNSSRIYSSYQTPEGLFAKAALSTYEARASESEYTTSKNELAYEMVPEIILCRHYLYAAQKYGRQNLFSRRDVQGLLDECSEIFQDIPDEEMKDAVDLALETAFPRSYPIFKAYEQRLIAQAEDIKRDPESYPIMSEMNNTEQLRILFRKRPNKWDIFDPPLNLSHRRE